MFSVFRRGLGQSSHAATRRLSTIVGSEASIEPLVNNATLASAQSQTNSVAAVPSGSSPTPFAQPLRMTMSALIPPKQDEPSPSDLVVELDPAVFAHPIRRDILHLCVVHYLDSLRQGTASTKTRGEVRGSGRKIRPQKGTGMARLGDGQSPMLRGGGVAFGPKPRDFATKLNKKVIQMGMRVALSAKAREQSLGVVESLRWPGTKTKDLAQRIQELGWTKTLFVTGEEEVPEGLKRASDNIYRVETIKAEDLNVYNAIKWPRLVLDLAAVEWFERTLGKPATPPRTYTF